MTEAAGDRVYRAVEAVLRPLELVAAIVGGLMMLTAMLLTTADALLRYGFDAPLSWNYYLTENYLLVGMICLPLAWGFRAGGYIRVMALAQALPARARDFILRAGLLAGSVYIFLLAWLAGQRFLEAWRTNAIDMGIWDWRVDLSWIWVPVGLALFGFRLVSTAMGPTAGLHFNYEDDAEEGA